MADNPFCSKINEKPQIVPDPDYSVAHAAQIGEIRAASLSSFLCQISTTGQPNPYLILQRPNLHKRYGAEQNK